MKYEIIKGSEKDFEGAPEWALLKTNCYYFEGLDEGLRWAFFSSVSGIIIQEGSWLGCEDGIFNQHRRGIIAERRPITEPVWDGEGLPPAGVECEAKYRSGRSEWSPFKCVAPDKELAFGWSGDEPVILLEDLYEFRPIRSPEDVARDETITSIYNTYMDIERSDCVAQGIYDAIAAGKIPGVKLEVLRD